MKNYPYNYTVTLLSNTMIVDDIGNQIETPVRNTILCAKLSVTGTEFYKAKQSGISPSVVLRINNCEYNNEERCEFNGETYKIIRTYPLANETELTLERELR